MNIPIAPLKRGATVVVRVPHVAGLRGYWYLNGRVRTLKRNGLVMVTYQDLAGKESVGTFDQRGFAMHMRRDGTVEREKSEQYGRLVPLTDEIRRIFKYERALRGIWNLTYADLLLMRDYELDFIGSLLEEVSQRVGRQEPARPIPLE
jgi:hypothetical protein